MGEVSRLVKQRGGHRAAITNLVKNVDFISASGEIDVDRLGEIKCELERQRDILTNYDAQIICEIDEHAIDKDVKEASEYAMRTSAALSKIRKLCSSSSSSPNHPVQSTHSQVKLPRIDLPKFSGNPLNWPYFWDLFKSTIHDRIDISGAAKFYYLVTQLQGEAAKLISGFNHTESEYEEATELLISTYGKPNVIIQSHLHAIFDLKQPKSNSVELRQFRSTYESHIRGLKSLEANVDEAGYVFAAILIRKLPNQVRDNINRAAKSEIWELGKLREAIEAEIGHLQSNETLDKSPPQMLQNDYENVNTAVFNVNSFVRKCFLCYENHSVLQCDKFKSVESWRQRVAELKLCFNCLRKGHNAMNCTNVNRCQHCQRKHHSAICSGNVSNQSKPIFSVNKPNTDKQTTVNAVVNNSCDDGTSDVVSSLVGTKIGGTSNVTLPTALVSIETSVGLVTKRALLDQGSQKTFITSSCVNDLNIKSTQNPILL